MLIEFIMRVAFVTVAVAIGGTSTFTLFLSSALRQSGVPCEVFSFGAGNPLSSEFAGAGIPAHTQKDTPLIYEDRLEKVYADLRAFKPTAVFAVLGVESFETLRYLPPGVARIGIFHDRAIQPQITGPKYRPSLDHLVVIASYLLEDMRQVDPNFPCTYLAHGIPLPRDTAPRSPNTKEPLRLLYFGRFENDSKGVRLFPEIAAALNRRQIPFVWTFHGSGPDEAYLKNALAKEMQAGQVVFSRPVKYAELPELVRKHDVYLLASTNEGGPLTLLESMALGLVPVCGDIPCLVREVINIQNGFRVPRDNPEAYADAIATLNGDRELLERLSSSARHTITEHYSSEAMAKRYITFLKSLPTGENVEWPARIHPRPILGSSGTLRLAQSLGVLRPIRRVLKRIR
jgi:glycosyltransferase involved in cell wall biosynthesis